MDSNVVCLRVCLPCLKMPSARNIQVQKFKVWDEKESIWILYNAVKYIPSTYMTNFVGQRLKTYLICFECVLLFLNMWFITRVSIQDCLMVSSSWPPGPAPKCQIEDFVIFLPSFFFSSLGFFFFSLWFLLKGEIQGSRLLL